MKTRKMALYLRMKIPAQMRLLFFYVLPNLNINYKADFCLSTGKVLL